jgi:hypothetical protein
MSALSATRAYFGESEFDHASRAPVVRRCTIKPSATGSATRASQRFGQSSKEIAHAH